MTSKVTIDTKGYALPIEMRPIWRISMIVLAVAILDKKSEGVDLRKINVLIWMMIRKNRWNEYRDYLFERSQELPLVSVDTSTYKALEFARAKDYISFENSKITLKEQGAELFSLLQQNEILVDESDFVLEIGRKLTNKKLDDLTGRLI